ncbi:AAA family ATPase [Halobacillus sp. GSS1]|uniref:AAA family ATPase n=1 Tax=Halobacillus sp. GSS1 TaxID=2815919 RepID=UPI001A8DD8B5|nr:AAA family ATPase [Halobacillus sp. GSS1]MBN9656277.1 AAA family ATPase [Halobacillus sp. GSS1]
MVVEEILQRLPSLNEGEKFILGIDGLSRSGKTTLTQKIQNELQKVPVPIVTYHIDDYIVERQKRYHTGYEPWYEYYFLQWDVQALKGELFKALEKENGLVILEGVFLQREEWRKFFDFVVYLQCSRELRFSREGEGTRKKITKFKERYWKAEDYYIETVDPERQADLIVKSPS